MRIAAVAFVLALLLPASLVSGGPTDAARPVPLDLFGIGATEPVILEAYYHALRADEYVVIANPGTSEVDVGGWTLTDREGTLTFPEGSLIPAGTSVTVAQNATAHWENTLTPADFQYREGNATAMERSGTFQLRNGGDEVLLSDATGRIVDVFAYGDSSYEGPGWTGAPALAVPRGNVARRAGDTNSSLDWDLLRVRSLGQADVPPISVPFEGEVLAYVSPDGSAAALTALLDTANRSVHLSAYTFTSETIRTALLEALGRGVRVHLLLEGGPVGGIPQLEWDLLGDLIFAGADVRFMVDDTPADIQERYAFLHGKYAILDDRTLVVSSENFGRSGYPREGMKGSRGWTLAVRDGGLAGYLREIFEADADGRRRDVRRWDEMVVEPIPTAPLVEEPVEGRFLPRRLNVRGTVTPIVAPDHAVETVTAVLREARTSIHAELFYLHAEWGPFSNPLLDEVLAAARRGVEVRVLLDASPYHTEEWDPDDNDDIVRELRSLAAREGLDLEAKLADLPLHGLLRVHNKGLLVDGRWTVVSSMNWNRNSATANREVGLLVDSPAVAAYFEEAFRWDWREDFEPPRADAGPDREVVAGSLVTWSALGSWDNVGVTEVQWDLDGDGAFDRTGSEVRERYDRTGTYHIRLLVSDAEGNAAEDLAVLVVRAADPAIPPANAWVPPVLGGVAIALLTFAAVRRVRAGINKRRRFVAR